MSDYFPLGECCNHILDFRGRTPLKLGMDWGGGNIPALSANNVKDGYIDFHKECNFGSDDLYRAWMTRGDCRKGDILFTMEAPMGNVAQVPDNGKYILSQRVILISPNSKVVCGNYLFHFLRSDEFRKQCDYLATGTTAKGIKQANLIGIEIPIPPLPEQKKIAEILSGIDEQISLMKKDLERIKTTKYAILMQLTCNAGQGDLSELCKNWEEVTIEEICEIHDSKRIPLSGEQRQSRKGVYPYYGANNIQDYIDDFIFDFDSVLLAEDGGYYEQHSNKEIAQYATGKYWVNNHAHILTSKEGATTKFIYYSLVHKNICSWINTGTRAKLNQSDLKQITIPLPPLEYQEKSVAVTFRKGVTPWLPFRQLG
jgi:type I restriction enzyme S subunit